MTVKMLINELKYFDDNMEVVMASSNNMYVDSISSVDIRELMAFYGRNKNVLVLTSGGQEGAV